MLWKKKLYVRISKKKKNENGDIRLIKLYTAKNFHHKNIKKKEKKFMNVWKKSSWNDSHVTTDNALNLMLCT